MLNFPTFNGEPVINFEIREIEIANGMERDKIEEVNPKIKFLFQDKTLYKENKDYSINSGVAAGGQEIKSRKLYFCPKCGEFQIDFFWQGLWD